jgi:hypothetical protein
LLTDDGKFCDCPRGDHIVTSAHCPLNIILLSEPAFAHEFEESGNATVQDIKKDEENKELVFCFEKDDCGAEPFQPYSPEEHAALAKKLLKIAEELSRPFITDAPCPSPPLKAHETDSPTPLIGCSDKLDGLLSPQIGAIPLQQVQVCALQVMVSAPEIKQSPNQEGAQPNAGEPRPRQIVCAAVGRDPRISRTSTGDETDLLSLSRVNYFCSYS